MKSNTEITISIEKILKEKPINTDHLQKILNKITSLDLSRNKIGDKGAEALAKALENNNSLTSLDLSINNIGDKGAEALATALENNNILTSLVLSRNKIGNDGVEALAKALENNNSLTSLNLSNNQISKNDQIKDKGAKALAKMLENNKSLTSLDFSHNTRILYLATLKLAEALENNTTLTSLKIHCTIKSNFIDLIRQVLKKCNTTLTSLDIDPETNYEGFKSNGINPLLKRNEALRTLRKFGFNSKEKEIATLKSKTAAIALDAGIGSTSFMEQQVFKDIMSFDEGNDSKSSPENKKKFNDAVNTLNKYLEEETSAKKPETMIPALSEIRHVLNQIGQLDVPHNEYYPLVNNSLVEVEEVVVVEAKNKKR